MNIRLRLPGIFRRTSTSILVLVLGLVVSALAAALVARQVEREAQLRFEGQVDDARLAIESRIDAYADVLGGVYALMNAAEPVSRGQFKRYVESLDVPRHYPGIAAISVSRRITAAQKPSFEARVRGDTSVDPGGYPGFAVKPPGERAEYVVLEYIEPTRGNEGALGLDIAGDPVRLAALEYARDTGRITATGIIKLALDPQQRQGFAMRLAYYRKGASLATVAQRREAFAGVVSVVFVAADLMRGVLREPFLRNMHVRIHDAGLIDDAKGPWSIAQDNLLFDSDGLLVDAPSANAGSGGAEASRLSGTAVMLVSERRWNLMIQARHDLRAPFDRWLPSITLLIGGTISLLLFTLTRAAATTGTRALSLADRITADLRRSEEQLSEAQRMTQQLIEVLPNPIFFKDTDGRYLGVNKAWEAYFARPRESFAGKSVHDLYPDTPEVADRLHAMDVALWQNPNSPQAYETTIVTPDGKSHEAIYYKATFRRADGKVAGLIGSIVDITERKLAEKALRDSESRYRSVVAAIAEGILVRDSEARIIACNASAERILGRTLAQMRGGAAFDPSWQVIREDGSDFPLAERPAQTAQRTGQPQTDVVMGFRRPGKAMLWLSLNAQPLFDGASVTPSGVVTTLTDITQRKQVEQRQAMEYTVTRLLAQSETLDELLPRVIQTICQAQGCAYGACRTRDEGNPVLVRAAYWADGTAEIAAFAAHSAGPIPLPLAPGGLIRRAWDSGEPVWLHDFEQTAGFRRAQMAAQAGLRCAFAFPIRFDHEVLGVIEFFSRELVYPDDALVQSTRSIGSQIGQFMSRKKSEQRVRRLANFDELTELPNRSMFHQRFSLALAQARRSGRNLALLFIDLDRFKNINDTLGHESGDHVLKAIADRLRGCLRESDTVARLGGDEFVVLMEELAKPDYVAPVAQKIIDAIAEPVILETQEIHITGSIGISAYPADGQDMPNLMKNADIAMYRAKEQGKNNYQFYSEQMNVHSVARLAMESDLRRALVRNEFLLHYQPRVNLESGRISGVEALVRWQQPGRALTPPAEFIPIAEETGLIVPIGEWVLRTACAQSKYWRDQGMAQLRVAVNLSARQFSQKDLLQTVARVLRETGLPAAALEFEITESMVMSSPADAVGLLDRLKDMGVHLSIDDFGTGYSSLGYLKRFPIDSVKIDRSFVRDLPGDADDAAITIAIIAMAHSLTLRVIAEGVETEEQLRFLREHGCDEMQGYCFSRPLPENELLALLRLHASGDSEPPTKVAQSRSRSRRD